MRRVQQRIFRIIILSTVWVAAVFGAGSSRAVAQPSNGGNLLLGAHFLMVFPQGDFKKNVDDFGFGVNFDLGYGFPVIPVAVGLEGGFATYGSKSFNVPFSSTVQVVNVEVNTSNDIIPIHAFARLQPRTGWFRPYGEGLIGLNIMTTSSSVKNTNTDEEIAGSTNKSDVAFSYGIGGGIAFRLLEEQAREEEGEHKPGFELLLDARLRMLFGGEASYFTRDAVQYQNGSVVFDHSKEYTSKTDVWTAQLGVMLRF